MAWHKPDESDSQLVEGGEIPRFSGAFAWRLRAPRPSAIPVLIAVPHAGRAYPPWLLDQMRNPAIAASRLEDRLVDQLGEAVARATGAALLVAHAPRAMIDLNRATDDVDWGMFADSREDLANHVEPGPRARSGLGLIPRRLPGVGELWKQPQQKADLAARIAGIHDPYHRCLGEALEALRARWGAALLLDLHSMPPLGVPGGRPGPEFVLGDRFGSSCHGGLIAATFAQLAAERRQVAHNQPYAGGYALIRHAAPRRGVHALQLESERSRYLAARLLEPGEGCAGMIRMLVALVGRLASEVAALGAAGSGWAEAAE